MHFLALLERSKSNENPNTQIMVSEHKVGQEVHKMDMELY